MRQKKYLAEREGVVLFKGTEHVWGGVAVGAGNVC